ncbi:rhomboid family intramembrane serine protease [Flavobacterium sp. Sd200]|uniref:rhomboid family intramembrane serine protease n=1 Tax=Flavobacterium sp. Sd200 TaxID=2692211 RepID=UPI00136FB23C|nr:rhomboid family intramembrane serine protease [Flavobacterium sp. Sd200]MXN92029.1 rhomboid family intramembrane serine protease [Flavobacterium sp. Sd200]
MDISTYKIKINYILPVYVKIALGSVIGFILVRYVNILFNIIDLKEIVWELWIPFAFPWLPITLWLRQRLRILTFKKDNDKGRFFFQLIAWISIGLSMAISQSYLTTATGKLIELKNVDELAFKENVRYYKINTFVVDTLYGGSYTDFNTSGKHNETLNFNTYFVMPIIGSSSAPKEKRCWYGIEYSDHVSNRLSSSEKKKAFEDFYKDCLTKLMAYDFYDIDHFERIPTSDDKDSYFKAIQDCIKTVPNENCVVLTPVRQTYESRNGNKLFWIFGSFLIGIVVFTLLLAIPGYSKPEHNKFLKGEKPKQDDLIDMLNYLVPKGDHFATSVIININIIVFLIMIFSGVNLISPKGTDLLHWGANRRLETMGGEWWRLFTSMFLHGGIMHVILNIFGLAIAGIFVEPILGRTRYFVLYIICGICGSLASVLWNDNVVSVGASGAIFGLYGCLLGLLFTNAIPKESRKITFMFVAIYAGVNLVMGMLSIGIDNAAHIGGLLSGVLVALIVYKFFGLKDRKDG